MHICHIILTDASTVYICTFIQSYDCQENCYYYYYIKTYLYNIIIKLVHTEA